MEVTKEDIIVLWESDATELGREKRAPVSLVHFATFRDQNHIIVVRDDSTIEIHQLQDVFSRPNLVFETKEKETITGIVVGNITSVKYKEVLFACYSGAVKSLVHKKQLAKMGTTTEDPHALTEQ